MSKGKQRDKMSKKPLGIILLAMAGSVVLGLSSAWADRIQLTNGQVLDGIIIRETNDQVVLQVAWEGHIVLDRTSIVSIEPVSEAERKALLAEWKQEYDEFKAREEQERTFEESQRAKGLILHRGEWVTKEELEAIKAEAKSVEQERQLREMAEQELKRESETRKKLETELASLTDRLTHMQEEQLRLQQEIVSLRLILARHSYRSSARLPLPAFVLGPSGERYPVRVYDWHDYVELPDGTRCDLEVANGRYRYLDSAGAWHEVQPATP